ncbi:MAG: hypothetical protein J5588_02400, partial [Bacteroidales bacterium]|nr:hypothetical protein [Bacteroidales bacterium]
GRVQTWLDGELALDVDTLRLRDYDTVHVDKFYLSTFHGGSSAEWAPTHDCYIRYDNFTVSTDSIPVTMGAPDSSKTCEGENCGQGTDPGTERIILQTQNRATITPVETYRIDGTFVGRKNTLPDATTHQLKNGKRVKVVR